MYLSAQVWLLGQRKLRRGCAGANFKSPGYVPHILSAMVIVNSGIVLVSRWFRVAFAILLSISSVSVLGTCSIIHPYMALTVTVLRLHALKSSW